MNNTLTSPNPDPVLHPADGNGGGASLPEFKTNILVVDDRPDKLLALEAILSSLNQNLVQARSGKEALRRLLEMDFAVILLDVSMPGMDGFETASLIRQRPKSEHTLSFSSLLSATQKPKFAKAIPSVRSITC